jgi:hypothetical protein
MHNKWLYVGIPAWILMSAAIAYGLVFWTPWFGIREDFGWSRGGVYIYPTYVEYFTTATPYPLDVQELAKRQPAEVQDIVKELWGKLVGLDDADLYILKSLPDVCLGNVDCLGLHSRDVKPFVEAALAARQTFETATIAWRSLYVAAGSLFISFLSVGIAALTFATRKR